jgi:transposase-like protein
MTVNNHNDEQGKHSRSQPRWSAGKKTDAVLRLLRSESLEELSRELKIEAHRLAAWRDDFLAAGKQGLKGQRADRSPEDRRLKDAERKVGQLTLETEQCTRVRRGEQDDLDGARPLHSRVPSTPRGSPDRRPPNHHPSRETLLSRTRRLGAAA